jgi:hypothetical protein
MLLCLALPHLLPLAGHMTDTGLFSPNRTRRWNGLLLSGATLGAGIVFLIIFFAHGLSFIRANSPTYDEAMHIAAGYSYLATGDFRLEPQNPPFIKELLALPLFLGYRLPFNPDPQQWRNLDGYLIGQDLLYASPLPADRILFLTRLPNLFLGAGLVALTGWWAYRLWGSGAALLAVALAGLNPNLVAHSSLVTTDVGVTLLIFAAVYLLWEHLNAPRWWSLAGAGIFAGLALVSKFSAILLIPLLALIIGLCFLNRKETPIRLPGRAGQTRPGPAILEATAVFFIVMFLALLVIFPAYFFHGLQPWLAGFYRFMTLAGLGQPAFFLGEVSYQGWWNYFIMAFLIKTPVGTLALICASLVFCRAGAALERREAIFLLTPVVFFFLALSQSKVSIGLRHILPIYPFLFVLASRLVTIRGYRRLTRVMVVAALAITAVSSLRSAPHQLAYFNEIVGGPDQGYRYLSDSNLDWGQDLKGLKAYMDNEDLAIIYLSYFGTAPPSYYGIRYQYVPGSWPLAWPPPGDKVPETAPRKILAISAYNLQDVANAYNPLFRWLWSRRPIAKIGYSIFVYDLTNDHEGLRRLEETFVKAGIAPST